MKTLICDYCNKEFRREQYCKTKNTFCSRECYWLSKRKSILIKCKFCKHKISTKPSRPSVFCNIECRKSYWVIHRKSRKAITATYRLKKERIRLLYELREFAGNASIINNACNLCGVTIQSKLIVHHIDGNNGRHGKSLNNTEENLMVLCRKCHPTIHNKWWVKSPQEVMSNV